MRDIYGELSWRGLIHQATDEATLRRWLAEGAGSLYAGFDPTAESLHVGSLLPLLVLRRFQRFGHRPIALVGGATGMIGDPSGKSEERNLLAADVLARNVAGIERQVRSFLDFDGPRGAIVVNNLDWMRGFSFLEFLRDVGKNFPIGAMLAKDSVKSRLARDDAGMSYTEFSYMLLQAYDFVHLFDSYGCRLQIGGSDQWGNITAGIDLARRMRGAQLYGLTCPLLTKNDGTKMGKTEAGAVWLDADRTSPYAFYQYWVNVEDAEVDKCLRMLTDLPGEEIDELARRRSAAPEARESQRRLAEDLTRLVHGPEGLATAQRATEIFFGAEITAASDEQLRSIFVDVPSRRIARDRLTAGLGIVDALVEAQLAASKGEARRIVEQGGAYVNNRRVEGIGAVLDASHLVGGSILVLRSGRKRYALLEFIEAAG